MNFPRLCQILADLVLTVHVGIVVFVVGGLVAVVLGGIRGWRFVRSPVFRLAHLAAIGVVVAQAWLGVVCPLTTLENWLRIQADEAAYSGGFIEHWLGRLLYYEAEPWVFIAAYTLFGLAVLASWIWVPPMWKRRATEGAHQEG
ncbi:MAG: DUF2784 domain-containing protein [Kiritimatiellia bacterium]|jgi:hypothetical protein